MMKMPDEIAKLKGRPLAVACSGGADSMALTLMAAQWAAQTGSAFTAITVDHGMRAESAEEARKVHGWLKKLHIKHVVLSWHGKKPSRNIQELARKARYQLMADYCLAHHIKHLLVAHHQEDQAETFLLRLARGSGVDGLSAMQPVSQMNGITLLRPLLNVTKAELISYLKDRNQEYVNDPSNQNQAYDRVRMREALPLLAQLGITPERLTLTAANMQRARVCLETETSKIFTQACELFPAGYAILKPITAPDEIILRILASLVMAIGAHDTRPRLHDLERLKAMLYKPAFKGATLGGCQFIAQKNAVLICREPKAVAEPIPAANGPWDRFTVTCPPCKGWTIGALTQKGWLAVAKAHGLKSSFPDKKILYGLPVLRDESGHVHAVPHLNIHEKSTRFTAIFKASLQ